MYTSTKVNHLSSVVKLGDLKISLQEHEQREEESIAATQGKKWIVREEKQQQVRENVTVLIPHKMSHFNVIILFSSL